LITSKTEYYFKPKTVTIGVIATILLTMIFAICIFIFLTFYKESLFIASIFLIPLILPITLLPQVIRSTNMTIKKQPVLILSKDSLIINQYKNEEYKWSEIKEIFYKPYEPKVNYFNPDEYIKITLKDPEDEDTFTKIRPKLIECDRNDLVAILQDYLETFSTS
jgi:hypothetical protein